MAIDRGVVIIESMNIEEKKPLDQQNNELLCVNCKLFFGSEAYAQMCSQCFRQQKGLVTPKRQSKQQKQEVVKEEITKESMIKGDPIKDDLIKGDSIKEDLIKGDSIKEDLIKEDLNKVTEVSSIAEEPLQPEEQKREVNKERCLSCNRKLKLLGIECKCGDFFCNRHRLPEEHSCPFNHKDAGKQELIKKVLKVEKGKIQAI